MKQAFPGAATMRVVLNVSPRGHCAGCNRGLSQQEVTGAHPTRLALFGVDGFWMASAVAGLGLALVAASMAHRQGRGPWLRTAGVAAVAQRHTAAPYAAVAETIVPRDALTADAVEWPEPAFHDTRARRTVWTGAANVREGPGTHTPVVGTLARGDRVQVKGYEGRDGDGYRWYRIEHDPGERGASVTRGVVRRDLLD